MRTNCDHAGVEQQPERSGDVSAAAGWADDLACEPDFSRRKFSREQLSHQERFREAAAYARLAAKREPLYAELAAGTMKSAYNVALSDWFHPPVIERVERQEGVVRVLAHDDVRVRRVTVLEGDQVLVEAEDLAGNVAVGELSHS